MTNEEIRKEAAEMFPAEPADLLIQSTTSITRKQREAYIAGRSKSLEAYKAKLRAAVQAKKEDAYFTMTKSGAGRFHALIEVLELIEKTCYIKQYESRLMPSRGSLIMEVSLIFCTAYR